MAVKATRATVSTVAVALGSAETDSQAGSVIKIKNVDATNTVNLGDSSVTATTGYTLAAGATETFTLNSGESLYAIRTGTADVILHVLQTGV